MWGDGKSVGYSSFCRLNPPQKSKALACCASVVAFSNTSKTTTLVYPSFPFPIRSPGPPTSFPVTRYDPIAHPPFLGAYPTPSSCLGLGLSALPSLSPYHMLHYYSSTILLLEQCSRCLVSGSKHDCSHNFARGRCNN